MEVQSTFDEYQLCAELEPRHEADVKAVLALPHGRLASASRDQSVVIWKKEGSSYALEAVLAGHGAYVNALAYVPARPNENIDYIASSGNSSLIILNSLSASSPDAIQVLIGHALNVCTLAYSAKQGRLISGSWDRTARIWSREQASDAKRTEPEASGWLCEAVLDGHDEAVWGVAIIDEGPKEGLYLTGSADRLINIWNGEGECLFRYKGSPEPVRSLALLPGGEGFVSTCNDGLVRKWDWDGRVVQILRGHDDYVYEVVIDHSGRVLSCGEDHTARVWAESGSCETILHPCQTVWAVTSLQNEDIVTGGSDGRVRVWTMQLDRMAPVEQREAYQRTVQTELNTIKAGDPEQLPDSQTPVTIMIDISDDEPPIPLHVARDADPRKVAEVFGRDHSLSDNYIDQIEGFIKQHLG